MKKSKIIVIACIIIAVVVSAGLFFVINGKDSSIVGTWEGTVLNMKTVYVFNKNGTYENFLQSASADGTYGTYSVKDGILTMNANDGKTREIRYSLNANTLIFTSKLGDKDIDIILTRTD